MSDLLVGCRASVATASMREGVIVRVERSNSGTRYAWILFPDGKVVSYNMDGITIHSDDVKFIMMLNKNYKLREKILTEKIDRFEILDL